MKIINTNVRCKYDLHHDDLIKKKKMMPPTILQTRIDIIFNNLNRNNFKQKCHEIKAILIDDYWPWIAQYLVSKCVSAELNFHLLYSDFLDYLKMPEVHKMVAQETYKQIKDLLPYEEKPINIFDRSSIKNLGRWLGIRTLRKNKPILQADVDIKGLLVDSYYKSQHELLYIVSFVTKILENCAQSRIFQPPNPWTMAIINILVELLQDQNLTLTTKFEIEILCKTLNINIAEVRPKNYLKNSENFRFLPHQLFDSQIQYSNQGSVKQNVKNTLVQRAASEPVRFIDTIPILPTIITEHSVIDDQLPLFQACQGLKQLVKPALENTIREWVNRVDDQSFQIALRTTEHIIRKDFALDSNVNRMKIAARQMVKTLTAAIGMTACRDEILTSIRDNLKQLFISVFTGPNPPPRDLINQTANIVAANNLELTRAFIQKSAIQKAVVEIDRRLFNEIQLRENARRNGVRYFNLQAKRQAERIPERIRLKTSGVTSQQMIVYKTFEKSFINFLLLDGAPFVPTGPLELRIDQKLDRNNNNPNILERTKFLLQKWIKIYQYKNNSMEKFEMFIQEMNAQGIVITDDSLMEFFKMSTQLSIDDSYHVLTNFKATTTDERNQYFLRLDAFILLISVFFKHYGDETNIATKFNLLNKQLEIIVEVLLEDYEKRGLDFLQLPYYHIFVSLISQLCPPRYFPEIINYQVIRSLCDILHILRPERVPGLAMSWLKIISHSDLLGRIVALTSQQKCRRMYARLLTDLFRYLAPYIRLPMITNCIWILYEETISILSMLLRDFPDVLSDYYYEFCDIIPLNCLHMKNIILSALPNNLTSSNMMIRIHPEIAYALCTIQPLSFKKELDLYLNNHESSNFVIGLKNRLYGVQAGTRYNIQLINALVFYLGIHAMATLFNEGLVVDIMTIKNTAHIKVFRSLLEDLDTEGRSILLNSITNHLRYDNVYTRYFSYTILCLFLEFKNNVVQEQMTEVLVERLAVNKPYPWGLVRTLAELIGNPIYEFHSQKFVDCTDEFKRSLNFVMGSLGFQNQIEALR